MEILCPHCRSDAPAGAVLCVRCGLPVCAGAPAVAPPGMVLVAAGPFLMGEERRRLWLSEFWIDATPVTHRQYAEFLRATGAPAPSYWSGGRFPEERADHPVVGTSLHDARAYARWAGKSIPTEEEWEKAARGPDGRLYPWGDLFSSERANVRGAGIKDTTPVGRFSNGKSPYGCLDMSGNVWEWTESPFDPAGRFVTLKGGSWYDVSSYARCSSRFSANPDYHGSCVGFRCVKRIGSAVPKLRALPPESGPPALAAAESKEALQPEPARSRSMKPDVDAALRVFDVGEEGVQQDRLRTEIEKARNAANAGQLATARQLLLQFLDDSPGHDEAMALLARIPIDAEDAPPRRREAPRSPLARAAEFVSTPRGRIGAMAGAGAILLFATLAAIPSSAPEHVPERRPAEAARKNDRPAPPTARRPAREAAARQATNADAPPARAEASPRTEEMVEVPEGPFLFGPDREALALPRFLIDRYEVTNEEYARFVAATGHPKPIHWTGGAIPEGQERYPVTFVSYADAETYAKWAGKRLPTEEEWEKAARGCDGREYPWGNEFENGRANIMLSLDELMSASGIQPVGSCYGGLSPFGCDDMVGNVLEWTSSWFDSDAKRTRVLKGGAWSLGRDEARVTARYGFFAPETRNEVIGFRCVTD